MTAFQRARSSTSGLHIVRYLVRGLVAWLSCLHVSQASVSRSKFLEGGAGSLFLAAHAPWPRTFWRRTMPRSHFAAIFLPAIHEATLVARSLSRVALLSLILGTAFHGRAHAELRSTPAWYDPDSVGALPDWHYRVSVSVASGISVNSTVRLDIDFANLLQELGVSGDFDENSVRVIRASGTLVQVQEFSDSIFSSASDAVGNARGEVRFLLEDEGPTTYWIYFDLIENGSKSPNPQQPVGGNFELASNAQSQPVAWNTPTGNVVLDAQVRGNENVSVTTDGVAETRTIDGSARTGGYSYLLGARSANEPIGVNTRTITKTIQVPAFNPGDLTFHWRPEGWDSEGFDALTVRLVGSTTVEVLGPLTANYTNGPYSPNLGSNPVSASSAGYGHYNGFDTTLGGTHLNGMTVASGSELWFARTVSLAAFAGQTITLEFVSSNTELYKSWFSIDDIEWSVVTGKLGAPQAFGVSLSGLGATPHFPPGKTLKISAQVDAAPTGSGFATTSNIYDGSGALVAAGIRLFNDGTHGDSIAGDSLWTNDGADTAFPTYTIPLGTPFGSGWIIRVFARDASVSSIGAMNGLARRTGTSPTDQVQVNFWNIDEASFSVSGALLRAEKTSSVVSDPLNGAMNPKAIPGALISYCLVIENSGPEPAEAVIADDVLPPEITFVPGSIRSGPSCGTAAQVEDDDGDDLGETDNLTARFAGSNLTASSAQIGSGSAIALVYQATIK